VRALPDRRGNLIFASDSAQGEGMDRVMNALLLHAFKGLLHGAVGKARRRMSLGLPSQSCGSPVLDDTRRPH
jgi:hypothetical protein